MTFTEIADRINDYLHRFETDPVINAPRDGKPGGLVPYWHAHARYTRGPKMYVQYISYQGDSKLSKDEAIAYLAWLDAGNVGRHFEALR